MDLDLRALTPAELSARLLAEGMPGYRGEQVFRWLHAQGVESTDEMTNVPKEARDALAAAVPLRPLATEVIQEAKDGTRKLRFRTVDGRAIESVLIPDDDEERDKFIFCVLL
jgi:23S rRNA (adenine2503-C2)-methyltransferase